MRRSGDRVAVRRASVLVGLVALAALGLAACGDDGGGNDASSSDASETLDDLGVDAEDLASDPEGAAQDLAENLEDAQEAVGGGSATLTIGDETWEFSSVLCAIGTDETQSNEYDFSLSAIQDGLQLSVSRSAEGGQFGDSVDLDDITDFENPSVSWSATTFVFPQPGEPLEEPDTSFVQVDGKSVSAEVDFADGTNDDPTAEPVPGTLSATCP